MPSRKVLASWVSDRLERSFCLKALNAATHRFDAAERVIRQRLLCQDRSPETGGTRIVREGTGRCIDHVFPERLFASLTYICVCLHAGKTGSQARRRLPRWGVLNQHRN